MHKEDTRLQTAKTLSEEKALALKIAKAISKMVVEHQKSYSTPTTLSISSENLKILKKTFPYSVSCNQYKEGNCLLDILVLANESCTISVGYKFMALSKEVIEILNNFKYKQNSLEDSIEELARALGYDKPRSSTLPEFALFMCDYRDGRIGKEELVKNVEGKSLVFNEIDPLESFGFHSFGTD